MKANAVSIVNKLTTRRMLSGSFRALNNDVKIFAKLPRSRFVPYEPGSLPGGD